MYINHIVKKAEAIRKEILKDEYLSNDLDHTLFKIPKPWEGSGEIKLVIIGQDPTVRVYETRKSIETILMLDDKTGNLYDYINMIVTKLGYNIEEHLYATNYFKCFFKHPPADNEKILKRHFRYWLDLIREELSFFPDAKVITLGEPVIEQLIIANDKKEKDVKYYWDYAGHTSSKGKFKFVEADKNALCRAFFPLPHQPSYNRIKFYKKYLNEYIEFINKIINNI